MLQMLYSSLVFNSSICLKALSTEKPQLKCCKHFGPIHTQSNFLLTFPLDQRLKYYTIQKSLLATVPFLLIMCSQDFTLPKSSVKSFKKATPFLNNESLNNVFESDVIINE